MDVIFSYSRQQALEDGVLVDVSHLTRQAGIRYPTAVTAAVWAEYVAAPEGVSGQDEEGRLWDIVWMLSWHIRSTGAAGPEILYQLSVRNDERKAELVTLKAVCGPGDDGAPVITIMLPHED